MNGGTDWTSLGEWVVALRHLHEQARQGKLSTDDLRRYHDERDTLAKAILAAQRLRAHPGAKGRQSLRVARELRVELHLDRGPAQLRTVDLGVGGFAVLMAAAPRVGHRLEFSLELEPGESIGGQVRVVNLQRKGKLYRVAFRFDGLAPEQLERVGLVVFEIALAGINPKEE